MAWTTKYKRSIDCSNPKGFSQKAHCAGRKARQGGKKTKSKSVNESIMKLTKEQADYIRSKKSFLDEGIAGMIFKRLLKRKLKNDPEFKKAVDKFDDASQKLQQQIKRAEEAGVDIPDELKKYAGMK